MVETAVAYVAAYLGRKALGVLDDKVGTAINEKLGELYGWVKDKVSGRPSAELSLGLLEKDPEGEDQQALVVNQLDEALAGDPGKLSALKALVDELDQLRPPGVSIKGLARAEDVYGTQVGVDIEGAPPDSGEIEGTAIAKRVHGDNIGVRIKNPGPPNPVRPTTGP